MSDVKVGQRVHEKPLNWGTINRWRPTAVWYFWFLFLSKNWHRILKTFLCPVLRCCYGDGVWDAAAVHEGEGQRRPHHGFFSWRNPHEDAEDAHPASNHLQPHHRCATTHTQAESNVGWSGLRLTCPQILNIRGLQRINRNDLSQ